MAYGWKGRIGLLVPATNITMEQEFHRMAPEGVSVHVARLMFDSGRSVEEVDEALAKMSEEVEGEARKLALADVNVIAYGCTAGSLIKGLGYDLDIIKRIEKAAGVPATTTSTAVVSALRELDVKRVAVATPYTDGLNEKIKDFLEKHGFTVTKVKGLQSLLKEAKRVLDIARIIHSRPPEVAYELAKEVCTPDADGVFISCTDFRTIEIIGKLENDIGRPVVTSNQATMWHSLGKMGFKEPIKGYGRLLEHIKG